MKELTCYGDNHTYSTLNLNGTSALTFLQCGPCSNLTGINYLGNCTAMKTLVCYKTGITSLDLSNLSNLEILQCYQTKLTSLSVTNKTKLREFTFTYIPTMTTLTVSGTPLTSLSMTGNTGLTTLNCYGNANLSNIQNLSACADLVTLNCYSNNLSSLTILSLTKLETLKCYDNKLTSLTVTGCSMLKTLYCYKNKISGTGMANLVNSLPMRSASNPGTFRVINNSGESNSMTAAQVTTATNKYWIPKQYNGSTWVNITVSPRGDVNGDGNVNMSDVTDLIGLLLTGGTPASGADANQDGNVNTSDVTTLINYLLSGNWE